MLRESFSTRSGPCVSYILAMAGREFLHTHRTMCFLRLLCENFTTHTLRQVLPVNVGWEFLHTLLTMCCLEVLGQNFGAHFHTSAPYQCCVRASLRTHTLGHVFPTLVGRECRQAHSATYVAYNCWMGIYPHTLRPALFTL